MLILLLFVVVNVVVVVVVMDIWLMMTHIIKQETRCWQPKGKVDLEKRSRYLQQIIVRKRPTASVEFVFGSVS